jgi:hypothetical protein
MKKNNIERRKASQARESSQRRWLDCRRRWGKSFHERLDVSGACQLLAASRWLNVPMLVLFDFASRECDFAGTESLADTQLKREERKLEAKG